MTSHPKVFIESGKSSWTRAAVLEHRSSPVKFETCAVIYIFPDHLQILNLKSLVTAEIY